MAAPIGAYRNKSLFMNKSGVDYEHMTAILQEGDQVMKERFYLDELFVLRLEDGTDGVIGMVGEGSENEKMHSLTTRGGVGRAYKGGRVVRMLNDAGLNTLGRVSNMVFTSNSVGNISFQGLFKSSYYNDTTAHSLDYKVNNQAWVSIAIGFMAQNTEQVRSRALNPLALIKSGDTISIKGVLTNEEGTNESTVISAIVTANVISAMYGSPASTASNPITMYAKEAHTFTAFYYDEQCLNPVADNYYVFGGYWYQMQGGIIVAEGEAKAGSWPSGDPANPSTEPVNMYYYSYSTISRQDAINNAGTTPIGRMWKKESDK